jgi:ferritin-like metal-binding protein YciE
MAVKTMEDLFVETLKDIYYAEKQILKALPGMVMKADSKKLKDALETHRQETEGQVDRLERVFKYFDTAPRGKKCEAIDGIIAEAKEHMQDIEDPRVLDAGMIGSAQAVEHYEITRYRTLISWAKQLGHDNVVRLLDQNLKQERHADELLTKIAQATTNEQAAAS